MAATAQKVISVKMIKNGQNGRIAWKLSKMATRWRNHTLRCCFCENPLWQWSQTKGRSPVWILLCDCKFVVSANRAPHRSHTNGRSPVCVRSCRVFCPFSRNLNFPVKKNQNFRKYIAAKLLGDPGPVGRSNGHPSRPWKRESTYRLVQNVHW